MNELLDGFTGFWENLLTKQPTPQPWMTFTAWGLALLLVFTPLWTIARNVITVVHEGGHAVTAMLWGRRISGIKLHSDTSGVTISRGKTHGLGVIFTAMAGYTAPAFLGLAMQYLIFEGLVTLGLLVLALMVLMIFLSIRNLWGAVVTIALLVGFYFVFQFTAELQTFLLLFMATLLTVASLKPIIELQRLRKSGDAKDSDADQLARLTLVPGIVWVLYFFAMSLAANALAVYLQLQTLLTS